MHIVKWTIQILCAYIRQTHACDISTPRSLIVMAPWGFLETGQPSHYRLGTMLSKATMVTSRWARWSTGWAMQFCVHTTVTTFTMAITMMHSYWTEKGRGKQLTKEETYDIILVAGDHATVSVLRMRSPQIMLAKDWNSRIFWGTTPDPPSIWNYWCTPQ